MVAFERDSNYQATHHVGLGGCRYVRSRVLHGSAVAAEPVELTPTPSLDDSPAIRISRRQYKCASRSFRHSQLKLPFHPGLSARDARRNHRYATCFIHSTHCVRRADISAAGKWADRPWPGSTHSNGYAASRSMDRIVSVHEYQL